MKELIKRIPVVNVFSKIGITRIFRPFPGSEKYWVKRYEAGGNSGPGSYQHLAQFKAEVINNFVTENSISTVIEYGCGDGNQLKLAIYPDYLGLDISMKAIDLCRQTFEQDERKQFKLIRDYDGETAEVTLSLDVIYHLIEDEVFNSYMERLFNSADRFVIIYSSNTDMNRLEQAPHVKHRHFTKWVELNKPNWRLTQHIPNRYPLRNDQHEESFSDFYIFCKSQNY